MPALLYGRRARRILSVKTRGERDFAPPDRVRVNLKVCFYRRCGKRILDVWCSTWGLVLLLPLFLIVGIAIKVTSRGPVFFLQTRVGRDGRPFTLLKFRSMFDNRSNSGSAITVSGDSRVTPLGIVLRKYKIDELPQFWNVLKGEMSLVGPRPEVECYVRNYTRLQREVLRVLPGITDEASIVYRREEHILSQHADPEEYYRTVVLQDKLELNLEYLEHIRLSRDLALILSTICAIFR